MGVFSLILVVVAPLLVLNLLTEHRVKAIEITFADPQTGNDAGPTYQTGSTDEEAGNSGRNHSEIIARNTLINSMFANQVTEGALMAVVCDGYQNIVAECNNVPTFSEYVSSNGNGFGSPPNSRKRRFASGLNTFGSSFFGSGLGSNTFNTFDPWPNTLGSTNTFNTISSHPGFSAGFNSFNQAILCPSQLEQSIVYQLNPDSTGYPAALIGQELLLDPTILDCLTREIVLETDPLESLWSPSLVSCFSRLTANATCQFSQLRLWSYQSQSARSLCWIMQNFQEPVLYRICSDKFCRNCKDKLQGGLGSIDDTLSQKLCITDYRAESVWSFCPSLQPGQRIIRDRIIIPLSCSCQRVRCELIPRWRK